MWEKNFNPSSANFVYIQKLNIVGIIPAVYTWQCQATNNDDSKDMFPKKFFLLSLILCNFIHWPDDVIKKFSWKKSHGKPRVKRHLSLTSNKLGDRSWTNNNYKYFVALQASL